MSNQPQDAGEDSSGEPVQSELLPPSADAAAAAWAAGPGNSKLPRPAIPAARPRHDEPEQIGSYRILGKVGEGGMGVVYKAEQRGPVRRIVALKVIKLGMDTREVVARFGVERQALALLSHANVAKVFEAGATEQGRPFFAMEFVAGVPVTEFCDQEKLSNRQRLDLFIPICQAIQHAHQKGIIHRDLKPGNVLVQWVDGKPVPKVIDFGVAKATDHALTQNTVFTETGSLIGTPEYMSPEQAGTSGLDVDTRTDVYSLGVILYELLTGTLPFDRHTLRAAGVMEMARIIREAEPPRPSTRLSSFALKPSQASGRDGNSGVAGATVILDASSPPASASPMPTLAEVARLRNTEPGALRAELRGDLDWIVLKAMEKERGRRYETAAALAADLQRYLSDEPVLARPASTMYRLRKLIRRHKAGTAAAIATVLATVLTLIALVVSTVRVTRERDRKDQALKDRGTALTAARDSADRAREQLFQSLWNEARARRFSRQPGQRIDSLAAITRAAAIRFDPGLRDDAVAALALPDLQPGAAWPFETRPDEGSWAFDGAYRLWAYAGKDGVIHVRTLADQREVQRIQGSRASGLVKLSEDGQFVAQLDAKLILRIWRVSDGRQVLDERPGTSTFAFDPNGRNVLVGVGLHAIRYDLTNGALAGRWLMKGIAYQFAFNPARRTVAVGYSLQAFVSVFGADDGGAPVDLRVGLMQQQVVAWHPDGERLAVASSDPIIQIWNVAERRNVANLTGHVQNVTGLTFHPNGEILASYSWDGVLRLWHPASGRPLLQRPTGIAALAFSRDGDCVGAMVVAPGRAQLLKVTPCPEYRTIVGGNGADRNAYYRGDVSPDGRTLAVAMDDGFRLWDLASGRDLGLVADGVTVAARFIHGGTELLTSGVGGLEFWKLTAPRGQEAVRIGERRAIDLGQSSHKFTLARGEGTIAVSSEGGAGAVVVDLKAEPPRITRFAHAGVTEAALSGDGRWLATSGWGSPLVRLWDVATGKMVHEWRLGPAARVYFAPDDHTLVISTGGGFDFWDVRTLTAGDVLRRALFLYPADVAFSADGKLMAVEMEPGVIHLKDVATHRTIARLEDPNGDRAGWVGFTPDGEQLITAANYARAIHVWDLRRVRASLKPMNLDWEWPEFPERAQ